MNAARLIVCCALMASPVGAGAPATPATAPATLPTQPAEAFDRSTPVGECQYFDQHIADIGIDKGMVFYHTTTAAQRRYARSELEWYVALNKLVRGLGRQFGPETAREIRRELGDIDDYAQTQVDVEGDAAAMQHPDSEPYPLIRIDGRWRFSMPDWFEMKTEEERLILRVTLESQADVFDAVRTQLEAGQIKTVDQLRTALDAAAE